MSTGENVQKGTRYFLLFLSDASERRVLLSTESNILASTFGRFRLYRLMTDNLSVTRLFYIEESAFLPIKPQSADKSLEEGLKIMILRSVSRFIILYLKSQFFPY